MQLQENVSLKPYNTFQVEANAQQFLVVDTADQIMTLIHEGTLEKTPVLILGGGSNVLFTGNFEGLVLKNNLLGIELIGEDDHHYHVRAGAGVNWHQFVMYCIERNYAGIENLSLIPGNVGASPMQNIGAYGVEVKDVIGEVEAIELATGKIVRFTNAECEFGYRTSIFKTRLKGQLMITSVTYRLKKTPDFNTSYGAIAQELENMGAELNIKNISQAVCNIRMSKLPDPKVLGNAGSFFKNPVVSVEKLKQLQQDFPEIPSYKVTDEEYKVAAGWLIEQCGWKGKRVNNCGVHTKQALVLVNYGDATGSEVYDLSSKVLEDVKSKFDIELEREVNII